MMFIHAPGFGDDVYPDVDPRLTSFRPPQTATPELTTAPTGPRPLPIDPNAPVPTSTTDPPSPVPIDPYVPYPEAPEPLPPATVSPTAINPPRCGWLCWALIAVGGLTVTGLAYYTFRRKR